MLDGESIRAAREAQGLSQAALAEKAGTTQQTVQRIEKGEIEFSRAAQGICEALGIDPAESVGARLNKRRLAAGLSMDELARAMGFAGQSSIQRYLMPDYNLELRPDMARKFEAALGMVADHIGGLNEMVTGVSPLVVLRTILCANPTAEQILAALAANGLTIVPVGARPPIATPNIPIDDPKAYVLDVLARHKLAPGALAAKIGVSPSTLTRALNDPDHKFKFAVGTLQKIKEWDRGPADIGSVT